MFCNAEEWTMKPQKGMVVHCTSRTSLQQDTADLPCQGSAVLPSFRCTVLFIRPSRFWTSPCSWTGCAIFESTCTVVLCSQYCFLDSLTGELLFIKVNIACWPAMCQTIKVPISEKPAVYWGDKSETTINISLKYSASLGFADQSTVSELSSLL